jgi:hypothetical protein
LANIGRVDVGQMLSAVNAQTGDGWRLGPRLTGGLNEGAHLVTRADRSTAVLKWRASDADRLLAARDLVAAARAQGWPTPAWLACGLGPGAEAWVLQEFIDGRTPGRLDEAVAEQMMEILCVQASLCSGASGGWGEWAWGVVFDDWEGMRDRARSAMPGGQRIVSAVDTIAAGCAQGPLSSQDLVHGNFNLANSIAAKSKLWLVDVEGLAPGPRAYDLAEALLVAAELRHATESAEARLWAYASTLDRREFAICAGSVALTMVDASARHGCASETAKALPRIIRVLEQARDLAGI